MQKSSGKIYIKLISILILISFSMSLTVSYSYTSTNSGRGSVCELHPGLMVDDDEAYLEWLILGQVAKDFSILSSGIKGKNLFSFWAGQVTEVLFTKTEEIKGFDGVNGANEVVSGFVVPCFMGGRKYFGLTTRFKDNGIKSEIFPESHFFDTEVEKLVGKGNLTDDQVKRLREVKVLEEDEERCFMHETDQSIRAMAVFIGRIAGGQAKEQFLGTVNTRDVPLVAGNTDKERALSILKLGLLDRWNIEGREGHRIILAFEEFWEMWKKGDWNDFDANEKYPAIVAMLRRAQPEVGDSSKPEKISNEGSITFDIYAYEKMYNLRGINILDCWEVEEDIRNVIKEESERAMVRHNKMVEKHNVQVGFEEWKRVSAEDMVGMDPEEIEIKPISKCLIPTDMSDETGKLAINENFVKLMHLLKSGMKGENGAIYLDQKKGVVEREEVELTEDQLRELEEINKGKGTNEKMTEDEYIEKYIKMGDLYSAILYSFAHHFVGHFPINKKWGIPVYNPDEYVVQGERGEEKYIYTNLLGLMYYWIVLVERMPPASRGERFIEEYPYIFRKLSDAEREKLQKDFPRLCDILNKRRVFPYPALPVFTDTSREEVEDLLEPLPFRIFRLLSFLNEPLSRDRIIAGLKIFIPERVQKCLDDLEDLCVLSSSIDSGEKRHETVVMSPKEKIEIKKLLLNRDLTDSADYSKIKKEIYPMIEKRWGDSIVRSLVAREAEPPGAVEEEKKKMVIGIEEDLFAGEQGMMLQPLIQELVQLGRETGTFEVVRGNADELGEAVQSVMNKENAQPENVIVLAKPETCIGIKNTYNTGVENAFLVGVNAEKMTEGNCYIRLLEMIAMARRASIYGPESIQSGHPHISVTVDAKTGILIFIPDSEPLDFKAIKDIYDAQITVLQNA